MKHKYIGGIICTAAFIIAIAAVWYGVSAKNQNNTSIRQKQSDEEKDSSHSLESSASLDSNQSEEATVSIDSSQSAASESIPSKETEPLNDSDSMTAQPDQTIKQSKDSDFGSQVISEEGLQKILSFCPQDAQYGFTPLGTLQITASAVHEDQEMWDEYYFFLDDNNGYRYDSLFVGAGQAIGAFYQTEDGGENWVKVTEKINGHGTEIFFLDEKNGWLTCTIYPQCDYIGLYKTTDGGHTWELKQVNASDAYVYDGVETGPVVFFSSQDGMMFVMNVDYGSGPILPFVTHDAGATWDYIDDNHVDDSFTWKITGHKKSDVGIDINYKGNGWSFTNEGLFWHNEDEND